MKTIKGNLKYKGYTGSVEYSPDDDCLFGKVLGLLKDGILYQGMTVLELKSDFEQAIDCYLTSCKERGVAPRKPYLGAMNIRLNSDIHGRLAQIANETGTTINYLINQAVEQTYAQR